MNEPQQAGPPIPDPSTAPKPALSLRIGITGLRRLRADQIVRIERQMGDVLDLVRVDMETLAQSSNVCPFYACEPNSTPVPLLRMVSPIARGADRVAAIAALNRGYKLFVPMPFAHDEYVKDFTGSDPDHPEEVPLTAQQDQEQFRDLLNDAAGTIQLDGGRRLFPTDTNNSFEGFSYEVVGHFVVRHCDLLVAIWDGKVSHGRGGTADIVRYAAVVGLPVWWIHATTPCEPGWLAERHDWRDIDPTQPQPEERKILSAASRLRTHLERLVLMPDMVSRRKHGSQSKDLDEPQPSPARIYFDEQPDPATGIWTTYSKMMSIFRPRCINVPSRPDPAMPQLEAVQQHWHNLYAPADARAGEYAARYRSSYVLIIALATLALALGAFAIGVGVARETGFPTIPIWVATAVTVLEFLLLVLVLFFALRGQSRQWHVRSIEYRLLAELFRKQQTLAALGWSLSIGNVRHMTDADRQSWVSWLFAAAQRAAPFPRGDMTSSGQLHANRAILTELINEQVVYHEGRKVGSQRAAEAFETIGGIVFLIVIACVLAKVVMELRFPNFHGIVLLGLIATVLPGVSAAFVGVRSYAELQLLAEQSHHMIAELKDARLRVDQLQLDRALASQDLGAEAIGVAAIMLQDLDGWGRLFRGKVTGVA